MKRNIIISIALFFIFKNINIIIDSTLYSLDLFINKIFVSVFPFMILSEILFYFDYHIFIKNNFIGKIISKLFNIPQELSIVFILSLLTSSPNNSIYIKKLLDNDQIDTKTTEKLLLSSIFPSISFVVDTIGYILYNNIKIGILIYSSCILNNLLIGLFLRKDKSIYIEKNEKEKLTFISTIKQSISNSINNLYIVMGFLILFTILINLLKTVIKNKTLIILISGLLEMTSGINLVSISSLSLTLKILLTTFIINFSGLSILFQNISILSNYKLNIKKNINHKTNIFFNNIICNIYNCFINLSCISKYYNSRSTI